MFESDSSEVLLVISFLGLNSEFNLTDFEISLISDSLLTSVTEMVLVFEIVKEGLAVSSRFFLMSLYLKIYLFSYLLN